MPPNNRENSLNTIPLEVLRAILSHLPVRELFLKRNVNRLFNDICTSLVNERSIHSAKHQSIPSQKPVLQKSHSPFRPGEDPLPR
ncbi:hypothetical protein BC937DRAFT_89666 [Endogone sp. FLAS-F59071]|nr:hypothetical protein BC937DRAFT_89666 [Endogone sp. FLAS-F59071]|eukprot:RUS17660.1 hypothetical protein BC937DRAFT_89666 [Endogone sp. FLAS-F59071]